MKSFALLFLAIALTACEDVHSRPNDWRQASLVLKPGMTEEEAVVAIGYLPDSAQVKTCGTDVDQAWECRIISYNGKYDLQIVEANVDGAWLVNSWAVY